MLTESKVTTTDFDLFSLIRFEIIKLIDTGEQEGVTPCLHYAYQDYCKKYYSEQERVTDFDYLGWLMHELSEKVLKEIMSRNEDYEEHFILCAGEKCRHCDGENCLLSGDEELKLTSETKELLPLCLSFDFLPEEEL